MASITCKLCTCREGEKWMNLYFIYHLYNILCLYTLKTTPIYISSFVYTLYTRRGRIINVCLANSAQKGSNKFAQKGSFLQNNDIQ